jgi:hypothetical protein
MTVLQLGAYDAILGYDWLKAHSPVVCHWELKTVEFQEGEQHVHLQGMQQEQGSFDALSPEQFVKWFKGNDIWAIAVVHQANAVDTDSVPEQISQVLSDLQDLFAEPRELPPHRDHDHAIPLLPNVVPINSRPNRYSLLHKDGIQRQVNVPLESWLTTTITSPFASPVLLVQKRMDLGAFVSITIASTL